MTWDGVTPELAELLQDVEDAAVQRIHKALPGIVQTYDPATRRADIVPAVQRFGLDGLPRPLPVIPSVPVLFPAGSVGGRRVCHTWPLAPGDHVTVGFYSAATSQWFGTGNPAALPAHRDRNAFMDAYAIPGGAPFVEPLASAALPGVVLGFDDGVVSIYIESGQITITAPIVRLGSAAAAAPVSLSTLVDPYLTTISAQLQALGLPGLPPPVLTAATKVLAE